MIDNDLMILTAHHKNNIKDHKMWEQQKTILQAKEISEHGSGWKVRWPYQACVSRFSFFSSSTAYFFGTSNLINLLLGIGFLYRIVEKPISRYPICWKTLPPSFLLSFYHLPICWEITFLDLIPLGIWISLHSLIIASQWLGHHTNQTPARSVASHKALGLWNRHAGGESTAR